MSTPPSTPPDHPANTTSRRRLAIIGGGISGLAAAQRIAERSPGADLTLLEASPRLGGIIQSTLQDGYLFEHAADSFIVSPELPWAGELCEQLGIDLVETSPAGRGANILRDGRFYPVPEGLHLMSLHRLWPLLLSPLLSWRGKLRVLGERFIAPSREGEEESLGQFARRRFGREMFERVVQPLVSGIYTADPEKLSVAAALPQFVRLERAHGSLMRAAMRMRRDQDAKGARYALFRSPRYGMQSLIDRLEQHLHDRGVQIHREAPVSRIHRTNGEWLVEWKDPSQQGRQIFDGLVLATSIQTVPKLLGVASPRLAELTGQVEHVGTAIACLGYRSDQLPRPLTSFGSVIPAVEGRRILAVSHTNIKFPDRAPQGHVLLRVFFGGALQPEMMDLDDDQLVQVASEELSQLMQITGQPVTHKVVRWPRTTPQYNLGHTKLVSDIQQAVTDLPGLEIANNAMAGVGVPQCVRAGWEAADRLLN